MISPREPTQPEHDTGKGVLSFIFLAGSRPGAADVEALASRHGGADGFSVSHLPGGVNGWAELLASGLAFDLHGLAGGFPVMPPPPINLLGLGERPQGEAVGLVAGPHLLHGANLPPVMRAMMRIGLALAELPGLAAVCWDPAQSWMTPDYFIRVVRDWLAGGAFPSLGLASLDYSSQGIVTSRGLEFLVGQDFELDLRGGGDAAQAMRIAVRLAHVLADEGAVSSPCELTGPDGEHLLAVPAMRGRLLRVILRN